MAPAAKQSGSAEASKKPDVAPSSIGNKKNDSIKGQTSISSFFTKAMAKPDPPADLLSIGTPESIDTSCPPKTPVIIGDPQKVNLQKKFADVQEIDESPGGIADTGCTAFDDKSSADCIIVCDSEPVAAKSRVAVKTAHPPAKKILPLENSNQNHDVKSKKSHPQQNTLRFDTITQESNKEKTKPAKFRQAHPEGILVDASSDVIMVSEFATIFRKHLLLEEIITVKDLQVWLAAKNWSTNSPIAVLHRNMLSFIIRSGETPDEERLLDEDTWPEVMRQHLQDVYAEVNGYDTLLDELWRKDYCDLAADVRLQALVTVVNDCLQTKIFRDLLDNSVEAVDEMKRQQQVEELHERYKKIEVEVLPQIPFAPASAQDSNEDSKPPEDDPSAEALEGMTERQRMKLKAKQQDDKKKREEDIKRDSEMRKLAEEDLKRKEAEKKQEKVELRTRTLVEQSTMIRSKNYTCISEEVERHYYILSCLDGHRRLLTEKKTSAEDGDSRIWSILHGKQDFDCLLQHYLPTAVPDKERLHYKSLQDMIAEVNLEPEFEQGNDEGQKQDQESKLDQPNNENEDDDFFDVHKRARAVVLDMEECTPDDIFQDHEGYKARRHGWIDAVCSVQGPQELVAQVQSFERELRRSKMLDGWDEVRSKWLSDLADTSTHSVLLYLIKQLRVYVGRQKPKLGKLASIFAGPMRMTRSQARVTGKGSKSEKKGTGQTEADEQNCEDEESDVDKRGKVSTRSSDRPCRMTRSQAREGPVSGVRDRNGRNRRVQSGEDADAGSDESQSNLKDGDGSDSSGPADSDSDFQLDSDDAQPRATRNGLRGATAGTKRPAGGGKAREARKSQRTAHPTTKSRRGDPSIRRSTRSKGQPQYCFGSGNESDSA